MTERTGFIERNTFETQIKLRFSLDGDGASQLVTGVPFLTHMLTLFTKHGLFNLKIDATGDTDVDDHHTTEDIAICLGRAIHQAAGDKKGINRYGYAIVPMDESLSEVVIDLSDRPYFVFHGSIPAQKVGTFDTELVTEFLDKLATEARMNLHVTVRYGENSHHIIESVFKALGRALDAATRQNPRIQGVLSTKGTLG
ncbi:imidazoleglycerol-phosphate dehydratase HisB [Sporolactobacillus sp. Y61]|jgi:imidazoleglycerol-phosphate dehydratase|uniref:Imidazoleglycerol-phosphate dehydratase n=1 Tax=Sporolactobacillus sp. Y61 TaxID=3160863 RepID=A0AAU8IEQ2_9BACL|nr:imidazoleglycerol-phosphate dehydratase HisB [Sporolactobacillus sp. THM19-2]RYL94580.1 imidazoleglycerol-phosphate dehydratase HisB [Sporolactobacillus sp. THM19-2]